MASVLCRGVGLLVKSLAGLTSTKTRCSSVPGALSALQCSTIRCFSNHQIQDGLPKRPLTSYFRFMLEQRPKLQKHYPEAKLMEISKMISLEWRGLAESAKKPYTEAANAERLKYNDEVRKYKETLSPLELQQMSEKRKLRLRKLRHRRQRKELTMLGKPKGIRNAYNIFTAENYQDAKGTSFMGKMESVHQEWSRLPHSQRQMYIQLAQDDKIRYENEMKAWEKQMIEIGREDLQRKAKKQLVKKSGVMQKVKSAKALPKKQGKMITKPGRGGKKADKLKNEE